jgi:predicted Zn-dependent peptidase
MTDDEEERSRKWFVLVYKLPSEPTRYRASVWRKLRAAGAVYLQNGVAALPSDQGSERVTRGLVQEVRENEGTAYLVRGSLVGDDAALVEAFNAARDDEYREVLDRCRDFHAELKREREAGKFTFAELEENEEDLTKLEAWFGKVRSRDRFGAALLGVSERAIGACQEDLEAFARSVYEASDHGSAGPGAT